MSFQRREARMWRQVPQGRTEALLSTCQPPCPIMLDQASARGAQTAMPNKAPHRLMHACAARQL